MKAEIIPGILTHNVEEYVNRIELIESTSSEWGHLDVMDGQFVPNITVMPHEIMGITTKLKLEAHLMTFNPERYFSDLTVANVGRVLLHREAFKTVDECRETLHLASEYFAEVGLVYNLETEIDDLHSLPIQVVQCMSIRPGASGQVFLEAVYDTIKRVQAQALDVVLAVDGGVAENNLQQLKQAGVSRFVMTSHLFVTNNVKQNLQNFNKLLSEGEV